MFPFGGRIPHGRSIRKTKEDKYPAVTSIRDYPFYIESYTAGKIMAELGIAEKPGK